MVIAIVVEQDAVLATALVKLHRALSAPLQQLKADILARNPVVELEIFDGNYQEHAQLIRSVIAILNAESIDSSYYEIPYGEQYVCSEQLHLWKVDSGLVESILSAADNEVSRQFDN